MAALAGPFSRLSAGPFTKIDASVPEYGRVLACALVTR